MNWDLLDYLTFGTMISVVLILVTLAWRRARNRAYRGAAAIAVLGAFFLVWVNGAVGIIGNEENEANLLFFGVLGVALVGAVVARFRARGMSFALYATAVAQLLVAAVAIALGLGESGPIWPKDILVITGFFSLFWLISGWLFGRAAKNERRLFTDSPFLN